MNLRSALVSFPECGKASTAQTVANQNTNQNQNVMNQNQNVTNQNQNVTNQNQNVMNQNQNVMNQNLNVVKPVRTRMSLRRVHRGLSLHVST